MPAPTVGSASSRSNEFAPLIFGDGPLLSFERICRDAAHLSRIVLPRQARDYHPFLSAHSLSDLKTRGGVIARTGRVMLAEPSASQHIVAFLQGVADQVDPQHHAGACVVLAARENQIHDNRHDGARTELLAAIAQRRLSAYELRVLVCACTAEMASMRTLRRVAAEELERIERNRS